MSSTVTIVNQHTNNFGDDAAGSALLSGILGSEQVARVDLFYIWHKSASGLPILDDWVHHHFPNILSGFGDRRPALATRVALSCISTRFLSKELLFLLRSSQTSATTFVSPAGANIGIYKDWTHLLVLTMLVLHGVIPTFCQNTVGKSNSRMFNGLSRFVLKRSRLHVRELRSHDWLSSIGVSSRLGVDTALMLDPNDFEEPHSTSSEYIALVPTKLASWHRDHRGFDDSSMAEQVLPNAISSVANSRGLSVVVVPHLYGPEAEDVYLESVVASLTRLGCSAQIAIVPDFRAYTSVLAAASCTVSMRYHGLVLSALTGTPCVALSYENKMTEAAAYVGMSDLLLPVDVSTEKLSSTLQRCIDRPRTARKRSREMVSQARQIAWGPLREEQAHWLRVAD